jgi:phage terminase small subunit
MSGPRRHTLREAALSGPEMLRKHKQRYGTAPTAADLAPGDLDARSPPAFLDAAGQAAWSRIVATAPPGLLRAGDGDLLAALAAAIARHERAVVMSQKPWQDSDRALFFSIERHAQRAARQVADLSTALGLSPPARSRLALPEPTRPEPGPVNPHAQFKVIRLTPPAAKAGKAAR